MSIYFLIIHIKSECSISPEATPLFKVKRKIKNSVAGMKPAERVRALLSFHSFLIKHFSTREKQRFILLNDWRAVTLNVQAVSGMAPLSWVLKIKPVTCIFLKRWIGMFSDAQNRTLSDWGIYSYEDLVNKNYKVPHLNFMSLKQQISTEITDYEKK